MSKKKKFVVSFIVIILFVCLFSLGNIAQLIINIEWFNTVGYLSVYFTKILTVLKLMVPVFILSYIGILFYYKGIKKSIAHMKKVVEVNTKKDIIQNKIFIASNIIISLV